MSDSVSFSVDDLKKIQDASDSTTNSLNVNRFYFIAAGSNDAIVTPLIGFMTQGLKVYAEKKSITLASGKGKFSVNFDYSKLSFSQTPSITATVSVPDTALSSFITYKIQTTVMYDPTTGASKCVINGILLGTPPKADLTFDVNVIGIGV